MVLAYFNVVIIPQLCVGEKTLKIDQYLLATAWTKICGLLFWATLYLECLVLFQTASLWQWATTVDMFTCWELWKHQLTTPVNCVLMSWLIGRLEPIDDRSADQYVVHAFIRSFVH